MSVIKYFRIFLLSMFLLNGSFLAHAQWTEARSDNFVFVGDYTEKAAEVVVKELEQYRAAIFKLLGLKDENELIPIPVYGLSNASQLQRITGSLGAAGVYTTSREGPVFALSLDGGFYEGSEARSIAYHEFTHHLIETYTDRVYPLWYNEGLAEYLSTFEIGQGRKVRIGLSNDYRMQVLQSIRWMPMDVLVNSIHRYPHTDPRNKGVRISQQAFYAQSWLATHYIHSTPGFPDKFETYLQALNADEVPEDVFERSFGITPDEFGSLLRAYSDRKRLQGRESRLDKGWHVDISVRKLSRAETNFHKGEVVRRFNRTAKGRDLAEEFYTKSEAAGDVFGKVYASRAMIASATDAHDVAMENIARALEQAPDNSKYLQIAGNVYLQTYRKDRKPDFLKQARAYLLAALDADPNNIAAHFDYAVSYAAAGDTPDEQAMYSALEAQRYYRSANFVSSNLELADVLSKTRAVAFARPILDKARVWGPRAALRQAAKRELAKLDKKLADLEAQKDSADQ